jgi:hypothetical protein
VLASANKRRRYVAAGLPYGAKLALPLTYMVPARRSLRADGTWSEQATTMAPVVELTLRTGRIERTHDVHTAALWIADRVKGNPDAAVRALMAIERARRQVFALAEEGTRWQ